MTHSSPTRRCSDLIAAAKLRRRRRSDPHPGAAYGARRGARRGAGHARAGARERRRRRMTALAERHEQTTVARIAPGRSDLLRDRTLIAGARISTDETVTWRHPHHVGPPALVTRRGPAPADLPGAVSLQQRTSGV